MQLIDLKIKENKKIAQNIYALKLTGNFPWEKIRAGQFVHLRVCPSLLHPLRRPLSIAEADLKAKMLTLVYRVVGAGTKWLSEQKQNQFIEVLGPLGNGFTLPKKKARVLIVGGGVGVPPLYQLVKELNGDDVDIVLGFRNRKECFWLEEFSRFGKVKVTTEDGSLGQKGFVTNVLNSGQEWDYLYACGPRGMLQALKKHFRHSEIKGYVSLEERMACGIGACLGCVCQTAAGQNALRVCKDGPVFPWKEVTL